MLLLSLALLAAPVQSDTARVISGVALPYTVDVNGDALTLNGAALRKKAIFKVYVAALYVADRSGNPDDLLAAHASRQMQMHFVRGVDKKKICDGWTEGLKKNTPDASEEVQQQFATLCEMTDDVEKGQSFLFTYIPDVGTVVTVAGVEKGTIPGKDFADAMLRCWIGPDPGPGQGFKKNILGGE